MPLAMPLLSAPRSLGLLCFAALLALASACSSEVSGVENLRVEEVQYREMPGGARIVTGTVFNDGEAELPGAQLQLSLYDGDNQRVGQMIVFVRDLAPGEGTDFREPVRERADVRGVRVKSILVL